MHVKFWKIFFMAKFCEVMIVTSLRVYASCDMLSFRPLVNLMK